MENVELFGILGSGAIIVICILIGMIVKASSLADKWIPIICGVCGGLLGILAMFIMPEFPYHDYLTACAAGIISGLAATGAHQVVKQLTKEE